MPIAEALQDNRVVLTGVTGFVGQALLSRLLTEVPGCRLTLLVRGSGGVSARDRVTDLLGEASAFQPLRDRSTVDELLTNIQVLDVDLDRQAPPLPPHDILIHVAGAVTFDRRLDHAFRSHTSAVDRLYEQAVQAGCRHLVHVSTAYVAALHAGPVPDERVALHLDWRDEAAAAADLAKAAEVASRQPRRLAKFLVEARRTVGTSGDLAVARAAERARQKWVDDHLVEAGRQRARVLGFTDAYTFTKACGERVAEERFADRALSIVRPTIVESALRDPSPGWIEGFKVADPLIVGFGRGDIPDFPGLPDGVVDIVPVDFVANAIVVAAANPPPPGQPRYVVAGTGARNPVRLRQLYELVRESFERDPLPGEAGRGVPLPVWRFPGVDRLASRLDLATRVTTAASQTATKLSATGSRLREVSRKLGRQERTFTALGRFLELYGPYALVESVFLDDAAQALRSHMDPADQVTFGFDPRTIDWRHYLVDVHVPSVTAPLRLPTPARRPDPPVPPLAGSQDGPQRPGSQDDRQPNDGRRSHNQARVLAVFDLDGTVADTDVIGTYLGARMADSRLAGTVAAARVLRQAPRYLALETNSRERFLRAFYQQFEGADLEALEALVRDQLADRLLRDLKPAAVRRIREHRAHGHHTVLITGALDVFCQPLRTLFDTIQATQLEAGPDGRATGHLAAQPLVGAGRAAWLRWYARTVDGDLAASYAYADSRSDLPMLRAVGNPVAVDPDPGLHREARRAHWPVAVWSNRADPPATAHRPAAAGSR